jgi:hypothetical protein
MSKHSCQWWAVASPNGQMIKWNSRALLWTIGNDLLAENKPKAKHKISKGENKNEKIRVSTKFYSHLGFTSRSQVR